MTDGYGVRHGVYGLRLAGVDPTMMCAAPATWTPWSFSWQAERGPGELSWSDTRARLPLQPRGSAFIDRAGRHTVLEGTGYPPDTAGFLHPLLSTTALAAAAWRGDAALHGGAVLVDDSVWALVGQKGAGKSSAVAWFAQAGFAVVADDLVITDGLATRSGPRFVDLRSGTARWFGAGEDVGVLGTRRRWRLPVPDVSAELPFGGVVVLDWGPDVTVTPISLPHRLDALEPHRGLRLPLRDGASMMHLIARPMLRFSRPKSFEQLDTAMRRLVAELSGLSTSGCR